MSDKYPKEEPDHMVLDFSKKKTEEVIYAQIDYAKTKALQETKKDWEKYNTERKDNNIKSAFSTSSSSSGSEKSLSFRNPIKSCFKRKK